jgi:hypothetical protein
VEFVVLLLFQHPKSSGSKVGYCFSLESQLVKVRIIFGLRDQKTRDLRSHLVAKLPPTATDCHRRLLPRGLSAKRPIHSQSLCKRSPQQCTQHTRTQVTYVRSSAVWSGQTSINIIFCCGWVFKKEAVSLKAFILHSNNIILLLWKWTLLLA